MGPRIDDSVADIKGYSLIRQDRNTRDGGVALYVRDSYKFTVLATSNTTVKSKPKTTEYILGCMNIGKTDPILVSVVYRPPDVKIPTMQGFFDHLKLYSGDYNSKIILGDFNANLLQNSNDAIFLQDMTSELALKVVKHGPTHFATTPATWINAIFVDCNDKISKTENRPAPYHNFHNVIGVTFDRFTPPRVPCDSFNYRAFNKIKADELNCLLRSCDWSSFHSHEPDPIDMLSQLSHNLTHAIDTLAPQKTIVPRKRQPPCVDSDLQLLQRKRDAALRRFKRTSDRTLLDEYFALRRDVMNKTDKEMIRGAGPGFG